MSACRGLAVRMSRASLARGPAKRSTAVSSGRNEGLQIAVLVLQSEQQVVDVIVHRRAGDEGFGQLRSNLLRERVVAAKEPRRLRADILVGIVE